jgi:IclR family pca regulon transcriptional regulator
MVYDVRMTHSRTDTAHSEAPGDGMENDQESYFVKSLERGLAVIRAFSVESPTMTLSEVAERTGMTRAAARRFLLTLKALGYVSLQGRQFALEPRVLDLGYSYLSSMPVWDIAELHMEVLVDELHESSSVTVLDGMDIVYVARVPTKRIMQTNLAVGSRLPAPPSAMGRVLLAHLPPAELDAHLAGVELKPYTSRTIIDADQLRQSLETVKRQGWALVDQELEDGVRSVATALHAPSGRVLAAINVSCHASRSTLSIMRERFLPRLMETAEAITHDLRRRRH